MTLKTIQRFPPERIQRTQLATMLIFWGAMKPVHGMAKRRFPNMVKRGNLTVMRYASEGQLWDWYEHCKRTWREAIAVAHPDRGGCDKVATLLNIAWARTKELFARVKIYEGEPP